MEIGIMIFVVFFFGFTIAMAVMTLVKTGPVDPRLWAAREDYEKLLLQIVKLEDKNRQLVYQAKYNPTPRNRDYEQLLARVKAKGGEDFLKRGIVFSDSELKTLIGLVHPDKHGGRAAASEMTKKLLELRK